MIKPNELRTGNWLNVDEDGEIVPSQLLFVGLDVDGYKGYSAHFKGRSCTIEDLFNDGDIGVTGILLTEQWLLNFGFFKEEKQPSVHHESYFSMHVNDYKYSFAYADFRDDWGFYHSYTDGLTERDNNRFDFISCGIKYVHQLQQLIFALTSTELTLKQQ